MTPNAWRPAWCAGLVWLFALVGCSRTEGHERAGLDELDSQGRAISARILVGGQPPLAEACRWALLLLRHVALPAAPIVDPEPLELELLQPSASAPAGGLQVRGIASGGWQVQFWLALPASAEIAHVARSQVLSLALALDSERIRELALFVDHPLGDVPLDEAGWDENHGPVPRGARYQLDDGGTSYGKVSARVSFEKGVPLFESSMDPLERVGPPALEGVPALEELESVLRTLIAF